jgi:hypothetical protein
MPAGNDRPAHRPLGRGEEAVAVIRRGLDVDPLSLPVNHMAGLVLSLAGYREGYLRGGMTAYREMDLKRSIETWDGWHQTAWSNGARAARLGHVDLAFDWLERAVEVRSGMLVWLPTAPEYEKLRSHPRYEAVLRRLAMPVNDHVFRQLATVPGR